MEKHDARDDGTIRLDDPWYDVIASGWEASAGESAAPGVRVPPPDVHVPAPDPSSGPWPGSAAAAGDRVTGAGAAGSPSAAEVYLEVHRSAAFREVRSRYRRFVLPASIIFLVWYFAYVIAATAAPGLMARPVSGALNVAMVAGLAQFATTFLLTYAYARHARLRRDRPALDLRWIVFEQNRRQEPSREQER
ncbi:DUF485 domain-containing protein [Streptomyces sp. NPDC004647]|uniref:DUF485 domain-containing protein n=1 Tax=Streptomyces sp. NPDC004647 TaxID=3154671 RepID=UPI0033BA4847